MRFKVSRWWWTRLEPGAVLLLLSTCLWLKQRWSHCHKRKTTFYGIYMWDLSVRYWNKYIKASGEYLTLACFILFINTECFYHWEHLFKQWGDVRKPLCDACVEVTTYSLVLQTCSSLYYLILILISDIFCMFETGKLLFGWCNV